ncbi:MAG: alpha/beta hydrolase [Candidatus Saccharimonadales bacterium]
MPTQPFYRRPKILWTISGLIGVILLTSLWFRISPVPGAFVVRAVFDMDARSKREAMQPQTPTTTISVTSNLAYGDTKDTVLDIYMPQTDTPLPVIVWTHGGAWLSGDKTDSDAYFKKLAAEGFVVVAPNYTLAPRAQYPTQINQLNSALHFVNANADQFSIDATKIVLAGDSAGAQLSSQMATIITNPAYAKTIDIAPALQPSQVAATVLFCGIYQVDVLATADPSLPKIIGWGTDITIWSLFGSRDADNPQLRQASALYHLDENFPPSFISGGNGDSLTKVQSEPLATHLQSLGVDTTTLFYPDNHEPRLPHENQFIFDKDGLENFDTTVRFIKSTTE